MENKETRIFCKECGEVIELKPGVPVNKMFLEESELEEPRYTKCYECRKKWCEENLKCKECGVPTNMHEYYWHGNYCELHEHLAQYDHEEEVSEFESKIRNLKDDELPKEIKYFPIHEIEYCNRGYACVLDKKGYPLEDEEGMFLFKKL